MAHGPPDGASIPSGNGIFQLTPDHSTSPSSSVTLMFSGMVTVSQAPVSLTVQCIDDTAIHPQPLTLRAAPTWWVAKITTG